MNDAWYVARIRTFLIQYSKAVVEQLQRRCVIVYTDESYVNVNRARQFTWYNPDAPERNDVVRPSGRGKRLVLLHAFTEHGWLTLDPTVHNDRVDQKVPSSCCWSIAEMRVWSDECMTKEGGWMLRCVSGECMRACGWTEIVCGSLTPLCLIPIRTDSRQHC